MFLLISLNISMQIKSFWMFSCCLISCFKYYLSFHGERNEEFMVCLLNDHLVAEAIELREGKMNSNHLHDFKNSGFCKYVELSTLLIYWPK